MQLLFLLLLFKTAYCADYLIQNQAEFALFVNKVNSGTDYYGDTIFLDKDFDFEGYGTFVPIGNTRDNFFRGTFIGQGHLLSNYIVNTTSQFAGMFGYSQGVTIKNFVLDHTCMTLSMHRSSSTASIGSVMAKCFSGDKPCKYETIISAAQVIFDGSVGGDLAMGGVIGICEFFKYPCSVKSCMSSGIVINAGKTEWFSQIGGIIGICDGNEEKRCKLHNCLNYGDLYNTGTINNVIMGGIVANMYGSTTVQNCVNVGNIYNNNPGRYNHIGAIAGYAFTGVSTMAHNFWDEETELESGLGYNSTTVIISETVETELDEEFIRAVNKRAAEHEWDSWILNVNESSFSYVINDRLVFTSSNKLFIVSDHGVSEGHRSLGNFIDENLTIPFTQYVITEDITVYSGWRRIPYRLTYVYNDTYNHSEMVLFSTDIILPELPEKEGFIAMWCSLDMSVCNPKAIGSYDLVLYPEYVLPEVSSSSSSWYYYFNKTASRYVKVTFSMESMYTSEVEDVIARYGGDSKHEVISIEEVGLTTEVVIEFMELGDAIKFIEGMRSSREQARADKIRMVAYLDESLFSFSARASPVSLIVCALFIALFTLII